MTVCQTCGVEGFTELLIHCVHCQYIAVHRYCVDGTPIIEDDEVIWSCVDCDPGKIEPSPGSRKSERIHSIVDIEEQRGKARRIRRNNLSPSKVKKTESVELAANKVASDASDLDEKICEIAKRKQGKLKENGIDSNNGGSGRHHPVKKKKGLDPNGARKESSEATLSGGDKTKDIHAFCVDGKDQPTKLENNLAPQLSENPDHSQETSSKSDEINDRDSISEEPCKQGHLWSDNVEQETYDNSKEIKAVSASRQRGDKQSLVDVYQIQTSNKKRRLVIAMEYSDSDEEPVCVQAEKLKNVDLVSNQLCLSKSDSPVPTQASSLEIENGVAPHLSPVLINNDIPAQPIIDVVWRGYCRISMDERSIAFGLEAHLSNKAHINVHGAATAMPDVLCFEIVQKQDAWPKRFEMSPPTGDAIGLYFFPVDESDEKSYEYLLEEMIDSDLVLKCCINNLELLVFSSQVLPQDERRFRCKYYLWSVFKRRQETSLANGQPSTGINDTTSYKREFGRNGSSLSSVSPSTIDNCSVVNSADTHVRHYARNHNAELTPESTLKHAKPTSNIQGHISPRKSRDIDSMVRSNEHQNSRKTHGIKEVKSSYHQRRLNSYKRANGTRQGKSTENRKGSQYRQSSHHSHKS